MTTTQQGSSGAACSSRKVDRGRRCWTTTEEVALIAALKELITQGWKSDNGFRAGYLSRVEMALTKEIPNCQLKAMPHINSRLASWKKHYNSLSQMLSRSGVGFSSRGNYMIECEDEQWEQILQADPFAKGMRYKTWPFYEDWCIIFGKDRANDENAEDIYEAYTALQTPEDASVGGTEGAAEYEINESETDRVSQSSRERSRSTPGSSAGKRRKMRQDLQGVCELLAEMNNATNARLEHIANRIGYEFDMGKARQEVLNQLEEIPGLSTRNKFTVCELVAFKAKRLDIWRAMKLEARMQYVDHLLMGMDV